MQEKLEKNYLRKGEFSKQAFQTLWILQKLSGNLR